jgi:hypothetical protein
MARPFARARAAPPPACASGQSAARGAPASLPRAPAAGGGRRGAHAAPLRPPSPWAALPRLRRPPRARLSLHHHPCPSLPPAQTRPNKPGEPATQLLLTHRVGQVDFKLAVVRNVEGSGWEFFDTMADPETTGSFKLAVDGSTLDLFATAPRKWCMKFVREADGSFKCISPDYPGTTAVASDMTPAPSKLGAGGLPKGQVNLGDQDEDVRDAGGRRAAAAPLGARAPPPRHCPARSLSLSSLTLHAARARSRPLSCRPSTPWAFKHAYAQCRGIVRGGC